MIKSATVLLANVYPALRSLRNLNLPAPCFSCLRKFPCYSWERIGGQRSLSNSSSISQMTPTSPSLFAKGGVKSLWASKRSSRTRLKPFLIQQHRKLSSAPSLIGTRNPLHRFELSRRPPSIC